MIWHRLRSHLAQGLVSSLFFVLNLAVFMVLPSPSQIGWAQSPQEDIASQVPAALRIIDAYHATASIPSKRTLHVVYWTPQDREPAPQYRERLTRVLFDVRDFYLKEMQRLGFGDRTISLATDADGLLTIHLVRGTHPYARYRVESGHEIRQECLPVLDAAGINVSRETIAIFCNMSNWDPKAGTMSQNGPYYASGGLRNGTAWQIDSPLLDPALITKKEPLLHDGQYGKISVGRYNTIFVGGVCHELGHALGLPHNRERADERTAFGTALMGSGNHTYREERRNEGRGSFLTLCEGLRLASHPLFTRSEKGIDLPANAKLEDVTVELDSDSKAILFTAKVTAAPPPYAVIAYMDPSGGNDYDATTTTAIPDEQGRVRLRCAALRPGKSGALRIVVCQANGGRIDDQVLSLPYSVASDGTVDISVSQARLKLTPLAAAVRARNLEAAKAELRNLETTAKSGTANSANLLIEVARNLTGSLQFKAGPSPAKADGTACWLSDATWKEARVGWLRPEVNKLPNDSVALFVGDQLFARGLYAHAPSHHVYELGGKWHTLTGSAGLAAGHGGSVVFVIRGDGKELWRSKKINDASVPNFDINVRGVQELTLEVENAGDGNNSDWGVWCDLKLTRQN